MAANSARIATFLRPASENMHTVKKIYKHFGAKAHTSRLDVVGADTLAYYNNRYDKNYGAEWAETPLINVEYLVMGGRYNQDHAKFLR